MRINYVLGTEYVFLFNSRYNPQTSYITAFETIKLKFREVELFIQSNTVHFEMQVYLTLNTLAFFYISLPP